MKKLIELLSSSVDYRNENKKLFKNPFLGIINKGVKVEPKDYYEAKCIRKSLIGHFYGKEFAITIYKDYKFYTVYIPNIENYGYLDYTIEETPYFDVFGFKWEVAELTKAQENKIWNVIKDYKYENNIIEEDV